jgi:hypothetical protein
MTSIDEAIQQDVRKPTDDLLMQIRDRIRAKRDLDFEIKSLEERLATLNAQSTKLESETLPDLFMQAGINGLDLPKEGNMPAYRASLEPFYKAKIPAGWPRDKQAAAMAWLKRNKCGDLIKTFIEIRFGMGTAAQQKRVEDFLDKLNAEYNKRSSVPWTTLTAYVEDRFKNHKPLSDADMATIGAYVGQVVTLKQQKED